MTERIRRLLVETYECARKLLHDYEYSEPANKYEYPGELKARATKAAFELSPLFQRFLDAKPALRQFLIQAFPWLPVDGEPEQLVGPLLEWAKRPDVIGEDLNQSQDRFLKVLEEPIPWSPERIEARRRLISGEKDEETVPLDSRPCLAGSELAPLLHEFLWKLRANGEGPLTEEDILFLARKNFRLYDGADLEAFESLYGEKKLAKIKRDMPTLPGKPQGYELLGYVPIKPPQEDHSPGAKPKDIAKDLRTALEQGANQEGKPAAAPSDGKHESDDDEPPSRRRAAGSKFLDDSPQPLRIFEEPDDADRGEHIEEGDIGTVVRVLTRGIGDSYFFAGVPLRLRTADQQHLDLLWNVDKSQNPKPNGTDEAIQKREDRIRKALREAGAKQKLLSNLDEATLILHRGRLFPDPALNPLLISRSR